MPSSIPFRVILRFITQLIKLGLWGYAAAVLVMLAFLLLDRTDIALVEFAKSGLWLGLWTVVPMFGLAALLERRAALLMLPVLVALLLRTADYLYSPVPSVPEEAQRLTVMTFNVLRDDGGAEAVEQVIRRSGADVVALQEFGLNTAAYLAQALAVEYPYQALHPQADHFRGQGVFSRYPILADDYWQFTDLPRMPFTNLVRSHGHQRVEIDVNGQAIVVYNVHPWPPLEWQGALRFTVEPMSDESHQLTVRRLLHRAEQETLPTLMVGDFNMSDTFEEYALVTAHLTDSQRSAGRGFGHTYPARGLGPLPALIRLDYVFHDAGFISIQARTLDQYARSDHRPVLVELALLP
ncbi:MAG: hypothetical protein OHK0046_21890 [Anaerolineae bacterium]